MQRGDPPVCGTGPATAGDDLFEGFLQSLRLGHQPAASRQEAGAAQEFEARAAAEIEEVFLRWVRGIGLDFR